MNLQLWILTIVFIAFATEAGGNTCFTNLPKPKPHYLYFKGQTYDFTLLASERIGHRLATEVLKILLEEYLGYQHVKILTDDYHENDLSRRINNMYGSSVSRTSDIIVPQGLVNLGVEFTSDVDTDATHIRHLNLEQCGYLTSPGRYGWFIPFQLHNKFPDIISWHYFKSNINQDIFDVDGEYLEYLKNNTYSDKTKKYICDRSFCEESFYIPPQCKNLQNGKKCATLLTSYPNFTEFIVDNINELKLYMKVVWLGTNLKKVVDTLSQYYLDKNVNKSLIFLEQTPSYYAPNIDDYFSLYLPSCKKLKSALKSGCKYELARTVKLAWSALNTVAMAANNLIHRIRFDDKDFISMLRSYNSSYFESACNWLNGNKKVWSPWLLVPYSDKKALYIGGIFPITGVPYISTGIVASALMAVDAVNKNTSILDDYELILLSSDGACSADVAMIDFIRLIVNNNYDNMIGLLGPACSESLDPLVGVSKAYDTVLISYSAEGSTFSDRVKYPNFFRTIGENDNFKYVYKELLNKFNWKRIAAFTEDGRKYTEYISSMSDLFKANDIEMISNIKFLKNGNNESTFRRSLEDLKQKKAKIIIADVEDEIARIVMCQAYKLNMISKYGYVWFLPSWLQTNWYNTTYFNQKLNENVNCTVDMMKEAINGYFSMNHAAFAPDDSIMQENITVGQWKKNYLEKLNSIKNISETVININEITTDYAVYAYDAVWIYAYAIEEIVKRRPQAMSLIHSKTSVSMLIDIISAMDFEGVSGRINFHGGSSRFSNINIRQWFNSDQTVIGTFYPNISKNTSEIINGKLSMNESAIIWFTLDGLIPDDGTVYPEICILEPLANLLSITCTQSYVLVNVLCFGLFGIALAVAVIILKRRYDKKIKFNEDIMKAIGFNSNAVINLNNLDKWETARECVILNRKLGEGAFGTVYGGEALLADGKGWVAVAVKTLKVGSNSEEKLDFLSEAESMKRFDHKNIVKLLGVCIKTEPFYTIMEFMLYGDLKTYLLARRHLVNGAHTDERDEVSPKKLTSMALDVARALSYLAKIKYVHRDVACRNCLVNAQRVVKLGDFGMTRLMFDNDYYRFNRRGMLPVRWMAPESLGLGIFTPASDIWSFAILLYEIITFGSFPFQGLSNNQALEHIKQGNTLTIPPGVKPQLEGLMKSCWNLDYKTRPHASEITEFLANSPRLLAPCLNVPISSIELEINDEIDILPEVLSRHTLPEEDEDTDNDITATLLNTMHYDNPSYLSAGVNKEANGKHIGNGIMPMGVSSR